MASKSVEVQYWLKVEIAKDSVTKDLIMEWIPGARSYHKRAKNSPKTIGKVTKQQDAAWLAEKKKPHVFAFELMGSLRRNKLLCLLRRWVQCVQGRR